ncbi:MAG: beta-RFAP synthase [Gemmataceae bacterium]
MPLVGARRFGGVGLMLDGLGVTLQVEPASDWCFEGPLSGRVSTFVGYLREALGPDQGPPRRIVVEKSPPEHVGLGTGTQLGMAVAQALTASWGRDYPLEHLARWTKRGLRSALGIHGFARGGFLVEAGQGQPDSLSPLVAQLRFPETWRVLFILPQSGEGCHGPAEHLAFRDLTIPPEASDSLCRLVLLGMLPAVQEGDFKSFSQTVWDFNARVGEWFAPFQGGAYSRSSVHEIVEYLRAKGVQGTGQSSWGPGVFAFAEDQDHAEHTAQHTRKLMGDRGEIWICEARNRGADLIFTQGRGDRSAKKETNPDS